MKKAIKKTCVVLLLFALLASQVAASYSETGTLNEGTSAISAAERYLSNWAYNSYMYADKNLTLGTVLDAEVDPASQRFRCPFEVEYSKSNGILQLQRQSFFRNLGGILFYYAFKQRLQRCLLRGE